MMLSERSQTQKATYWIPLFTGNVQIGKSIEKADFWLLRLGGGEGWEYCSWIQAFFVGDEHILGLN